MALLENKKLAKVSDEKTASIVDHGVCPQLDCRHAKVAAQPLSVCTSLHQKRKASSSNTLLKNKN